VTLRWVIFGREASVQKWEYCGAQILTVVETQVWFYGPDGIRYAKLRDIGELGLQGWELVACRNSELYFKRPLPETCDAPGE
jgi:hypothetical protein